MEGLVLQIAGFHSIYFYSFLSSAGLGGAQPPGGHIQRPPAGRRQHQGLPGPQGEDQEGQDGRHAGGHQDKQLATSSYQEVNIYFLQTFFPNQENFY